MGSQSFCCQHGDRTHGQAELLRGDRTHGQSEILLAWGTAAATAGMGTGPMGRQSCCQHVAAAVSAAASGAAAAAASAAKLGGE